MIFDKYVNEGYGARPRIATWLNKQGYRARSGKPWHHASIRGILCNLTLLHRSEGGESRSRQEHLQIITPEQFETARRIRESRANAALLKRTSLRTPEAARFLPATSTAVTAGRGWRSPQTASPTPAPLTRTAL